MASKRVSLKGKGADLFFGDYTPSDSTSTDPPDGRTVPELDEQPVSLALPSTTLEEPEAAARATAGLRIAHDPKTMDIAEPRTERKRTSTISSNHASKQSHRPVSTPHSDIVLDPTIIEALRRAVREPGREVAYVRLTPEEKVQIADIAYSYKRRGQRTTENEIYRIAINHLLHDYHQHGDASVLAQVLAALLA